MRAALLEQSMATLCATSARSCASANPQSLTLTHPHPGDGPTPRNSSTKLVNGLHIVSYNLELIEKFVTRVGNSAAGAAEHEQREVVEKLIAIVYRLETAVFARA